MTEKTTYSVLSEMDDHGLLTDAIKKEIVPVTSGFHKLVYEVYLNRKKSLNKTQAVMDTAIEVQMSERAVWYIIKKMES